MTQMPDSGAVPEFTLGDRLARSLKHSDVSVADMAAYLDVHRNTISAYLNDRQAVKRQTLMLWAMRTGVSLDWLETGQGSSSPNPPTPGRRDESALAALVAEKAARSRAGDTSRYASFPPAAASAA